MEKSEKRFRSNGKLLLSGEYLVLHGAWSLAVPTILGQSLVIKDINTEGTLVWKTKVVSEPWLDCEINPDNWQIIFADNPYRAEKLIRILQTASEIRGDTDWLKGKAVVSEVEFDIEWGLGSSSSLISNIAGWAEIDPFLLSRYLSLGSGYDIACARSDKPLLYKAGDTEPRYIPIDFLPPFHEQLAFVYLGRKQDSASSVRNFLNKALVREHDILKISAISEKFCSTEKLEEFEDLMMEHELILSQILGLPQVKHGLFHDYRGEVKSLGAWGGDFVMVTMHQEWPAVETYFSEKGMETVIPYQKMVKAL